MPRASRSGSPLHRRVLPPAVFSELGDGTFTRRTQPVPVVAGGPWQHISSGYRFTCGVQAADSAVYCWGGAGPVGWWDRNVPTLLYAGMSTPLRATLVSAGENFAIFARAANAPPAW